MRRRGQSVHLDLACSDPMWRKWSSEVCSLRHNFPVRAHGESPADSFTSAVTARDAAISTWSVKHMPLPRGRSFCGSTFAQMLSCTSSRGFVAKAICRGSNAPAWTLGSGRSRSRSSPIKAKLPPAFVFGGLDASPGPRRLKHVRRGTPQTVGHSKVGAPLRSTLCRREATTLRNENRARDRSRWLPLEGES